MPGASWNDWNSIVKWPRDYPVRLADFMYMHISLSLPLGTMQFRKHLEVTRLQLHKCRSFSNFGPKGDGFRRRLFLSSRPSHRNLLAEAPPVHCLRKFALKNDLNWLDDWSWLIMIDHVRVSNVSNVLPDLPGLLRGFTPPHQPIGPRCSRVAEWTVTSFINWTRSKAWVVPCHGPNPQCIGQDKPRILSRRSY